MVWTCFIVVFIWLLPGFECQVPECLPEGQFKSDCAEPFLSWDQNGSLSQKICGNGTAVFECIRRQIQGNCDYRNQTVDDLFTSRFQGVNYDLNIICEIYNNSDCANVLQCFVDSFYFDNTNNSVVGFYNFFCGPNYLQKGYSCLNTTACPYSTARALQSMVFLLSSNQQLSLSDLREPVQAMCGNLTDEDKSCITGNANSLANCGIDPVIKTYPTDSQLTCDATDKSNECVKTVCSENVANVYLNMFGLLECTLRVVCGQLVENSLVWLQTSPGETRYVACSGEATTGVISRTCLLDGSWGPVQNSCQISDDAVEDVVDQLDDILNSTVPDSSDNSTDTVNATTPSVEDVLDNLNNVLEGINNVTDSGQANLTASSVGSIVQILDSSLTLVQGADPNETQDILDTIFESINNLVDLDNTEVWLDITNDETSTVQPSSVLDVTDKYIETVQNQICNSPQGEDFVKTEENVYLAVGQKENDIMFPSVQAQQSVTQIDLTFADISIQADTLRNKGLNGPVCVGGSYFTTLGQLLETNEEENGVVTDFGDVKEVNSNIVSVLIDNSTGIQLTELDPPISVRLRAKKSGYINPVCVFWDYEVPSTTPGRKGAWSDRGCQLLSFVNETVNCSCNHLTNFAVLMSPNSPINAKALNIISAVGCGISIVCLLLTIVLHLMVWRLVRSDRATILMNLCIALLLALTIFLAGINRVESRVACAAIAAVIQFLFLAVFFLMFLMGIEILICVVHVFGTKFRIKLLLPLVWGAAALVVGISLGVTKAKGYGNDQFCWLDTSSGLIWAFIGPAAFVIFANFIVMAVVFKKMSTSAILKTKSAKTKALTTARSLCVLLPLMGVTWVFGLLALNEDTAFFAYLFAIVNSLQGLFIFLFHCVFNRQIRDAWKQRQARKRSLQTFSSDFRGKSKSAIHSNTFDSPEKKRNGSATDSEEHSNTPPSSRKPNGLIKEEDWERYERKQYHKNIRIGNIYK